MMDSTALARFGRKVSSQHVSTARLEPVLNLIQEASRCISNRTQNNAFYDQSEGNNN